MVSLLPNLCSVYSSRPLMWLRSLGCLTKLLSPWTPWGRGCLTFGRGWILPADRPMVSLLQKVFCHQGCLLHTYHDVYLRPVIRGVLSRTMSAWNTQLYALTLPSSSLRNSHIPPYARRTQLIVPSLLPLCVGAPILTTPSRRYQLLYQ